MRIFKRATTTFMSAGEAITETLVSRGVKHVVSITGSAFLPASDCFASAGIRMVHVQHEQNAGFCIDGYTRVLPGSVGVTVNQAGPGCSNLLTSMATSYWNHSPVVYITPAVETTNQGKGVFQELRGQDVLFKDQVKYHGNTPRADRVAEILGKGIDRARSEQGPAQVNIPRDFFNAYEEYAIPKVMAHSASGACNEDIRKACDLIQSAKTPVILAGAGVGWSPTGDFELDRLCDETDIPVAMTYGHNDAFSSSNGLNVGPLGYFGARSAMRMIQKADLVVAVGSRIGPFSVTKQYGIEYWNTDRKLIQIDVNRSNLGLSCSPNLSIQGDAGMVMAQLTEALGGRISKQGGERAEHENKVWNEELKALIQTTTIPEDGAIAPKKALDVIGRYIHALDHPVLSTDTGNVCSQMNMFAKFEKNRSYLTPGMFGSCGYSVAAAMGAKLAMPDREVFALVGDGAFMMNPVSELLTLIREKIPICILVARNNRWWAEGMNQHMYFGKRYEGTCIESPSFAEVANAMGSREDIVGIEVRDLSELTPALDTALTNQRNGTVTLVEIHMTPEPTPVFREDAMHSPVRYLPKYMHLNKSNPITVG